MPTFTVDADLPVSASRIWQALKDAPAIVPKIAPQAVASMEDIEGKGEEVGAVRLIKLGSAAPPGAFVKEKLIALDHSSFTVTTAEVEGGHLAQGFSKWVTTWKFTSSGASSSKWEGTIEYEGNNEAAIAQSKDGMTKLFLGLSMYINETGAYAEV